jgi:hypothetical protein
MEKSKKGILYRKAEDKNISLKSKTKIFVEKLL